jgi:hypothetical protein
VASGQEHQYWRVEKHLGERPLDRRAKLELRERFNLACAAFVNAQGTPALNVTGGFDTRAVLSGAQRTGRRLTGVTSGLYEKQSVDAVVAAAGIEHHYFPYTRRREAEGNVVFALLTDGEWDATAGGALLDYWRRVSKVAPSGCLHGGAGEVWRCYHYKFLWPPVASILRDPIGCLTRTLWQPRSHLLPVLQQQLRAGAADLLRQDTAALWSFIGGGTSVAAVDAFYLLERQRGLTRIASAADLHNPAYSPFGHSLFCEAALNYLGVQNRAELLHREIISGNSPRLAAVRRPDGGSCETLNKPESLWRQVRATLRHQAGRTLGPRLRRRLKPSRQLSWDDVNLSFGTSDVLAIFELSVLRRVLQDDPAADGLGSVVAIASATSAPCPAPRARAAADATAEPVRTGAALRS